MADTFQQRLSLLRGASLLPQLAHIVRGIEKEGLRTTPSGELAQTPHPKGLGSALTHDSITTDYSEALLEFITPALEAPQAAVDCLKNIHSFVYKHIDDELIWPASMPCILHGEDSIPIAEYGSSNTGTLKHVYRIGLAHRYGKTMQAIAGVHYNFSLPASFWPLYQSALGGTQDDQHFQTEQYFALIRNFHRYSWLVLYLFGASPALCASFMEDRDTHQLDVLDDHTLFMPESTSLRMGDLGYQNNAQQGIDVCYNSLERYVEGLGKAIHSPHPAYQAIGIKVDGEYRQLNANVLQIENEYYSDIRPKRVTPSCQKPLHILAEQGVEYIEVRNLDINPFLPVGIDEQQIRFMDSFLLFCLLEESPSCEEAQSRLNVRNKSLVVNTGRQPDIRLFVNETQSRTLQDWGQELLDKIAAAADLLDQAHGKTEKGLYRAAAEAQQEKLLNPCLTPSAQVLAALKEGRSFTELCLELACQHRDYFASHPPSDEVLVSLAEQSRQSLLQQQQLEASDKESFDDFLARYNAQ